MEVKFTIFTLIRETGDFWSFNTYNKLPNSVKSMEDVKELMSVRNKDPKHRYTYKLNTDPNVYNALTQKADAESIDDKVKDLKEEISNLEYSINNLANFVECQIKEIKECEKESEFNI